MRALLDAVPDMIYEFTGDGPFVQFISSPTNRPLLPPEEFMGKSIREIMPSVADQTLFAIDRVLESGHVHAFDYQLLQDNENKTFEARFAQLGSDTVLAIVREVTLQKWILGEREKLITELESKNAELERFTYTVSHGRADRVGAERQQVQRPQLVVADLGVAGADVLVAAGEVSE